MSTASISDPPGWFGKLPALGDFASRRLPDAFVAACDAWLQEGLREGQLALGKRWLTVYLQGPILRFRIGPGVIDAASWQGVLMPSVDRVGRYFPLVIASTVADAATEGAAAGEAWFRAVEDCAIEVLDPERTVEDFEASLALLDPNALTCDTAGAEQAELPASGESLWWDRDAAALRCQGLPTPQQFIVLLTAGASASEDVHE